MLPESPVPGDVICGTTPLGAWLTVSVTGLVSPGIRWIVTVTAGDAALSGAVAEAEEREIVIGCGSGEELPPQAASKAREPRATKSADLRNMGTSFSGRGAGERAEMSMTENGARCQKNLAGARVGWLRCAQDPPLLLKNGSAQDDNLERMTIIE
jgi:hypothetical protein